jgi:large conductance mechanosensitive channel
MLQEFTKFIARGNVIDLAVGIIMGTAFTAIVTSLVNDIIMPPIGVVLGGVDFSNLFLTLRGGPFPSLAVAQQAGAATVNYGVFINAIIKFVIVALAVFLLVKQVNKLQQLLIREEKKEEAKAAPSKTEVLLTEIRDLLKARAS